jgi:hypothetical protein
MRIAVHSPKLDLARQGGAYAEYRMFSAVSRFGMDRARLRVHLFEDDGADPGARYQCAVVLECPRAGRIRVRATAEGIYRVVDAAAERLARCVERRLGVTRAGLATPMIKRGAR